MAEDIRNQIERMRQANAQKGVQKGPSGDLFDDLPNRRSSADHAEKSIGFRLVAGGVALALVGGVGWQVKERGAAGAANYIFAAGLRAGTGFIDGLTGDDKTAAATKPSASPTLEVTPTPSPSPTDLPPTAQECIADMPTAYKLAQNMFVPVDQDGTYHTNSQTSLKETFAILDKYNIGNVIVMGDPTKDPNQAIKQFSDTAIFEDPLIVANDQEGGIVKRISNGMPSQDDISAKMTPAQAEKAMAQFYKSTKAAGVDMVFGPVADVTPENKKPSAIGQERIFRGTPEKVGQYVISYVKAAEAQGVSPVVKHFPGGGSMESNTDTSDGTTFIPSKKQLDAYDLKAWANASDAIHHAMLSTAATRPDDRKDPKTSWTENQPAVFSKAVYDELKELGIDGLITTDDLGTKALVEKDGEPMILPKSFVKVWANGGTPLFVEDIANKEVKKILPMEKRIKTIIDAGVNAVDSGDISKETLNRMMEVHLAIQDRDAEACDILERLENEKDSLAIPVVKQTHKPSPTPSPSSAFAKPSPAATPTKSASPKPSPTKK